MPAEEISRGGHAGSNADDRTPTLPTASAVSSTRPQPNIAGRAHVIDGDTIVISGANIRLFGIDAPELDHPWGIDAKWALVKLCKGQTVTAEMTGALSHERLVARCTLEDGRDLSSEMVRAGFALDWPKYSGGVYRHLEVAGIRKKFWRAAARQRGRMPGAPRAGSMPRPTRSEKRT